MRKKFQAVLILSACLLTGMLVGCSSGLTLSEKSTEEDYAVVTDQTGRTVSLPGPAERIVALTAADCEILYEIGAGDRIVGRGAYCNYPEEVLKVPAVQFGQDINIEQILALKPDVVFTNTTTQSDEQILSLERAGIEVIMYEERDIAAIYDYISLAGTVTGMEEGADDLIHTMKSSFASLSGEGEEGKTIYFEVSPLEYGLWTAGQGTYMNEICQMIGVENIFQDVENWAEVSEEQVIQRNPDYIVTVAMYDGGEMTPEEEICSRPGWETITAVKKGAVLNLQNHELTRPSPRLLEGARMLHQFIKEAK